VSACAHQHAVTDRDGAVSCPCGARVRRRVVYFDTAAPRERDVCATCELPVGAHDTVAYDRAHGRLHHAACVTGERLRVTYCTECLRTVPAYARYCPHCQAGGDSCWPSETEAAFEAELVRLELLALERVRDRRFG
jgi:hypothetical protein